MVQRILAISVFVLLSFAGFALAQDTPTARILVVDTRAILRDADAAQDVSRQIERVRQQVEDEIRDQEARLKAEDEELTRQRSVLTPQKFEDRRREFEDRVRETQRRAQDDGRRVQLALSRSMSELQLALEPILKEIMVERGASLLLDKSQVLVSDNDIDITDEAIRRLNDRLPSIEVRYPER